MCDYALKYIFLFWREFIKTKFDYSCGRERQGARQEEWLLGKEKYITKRKICAQEKVPFKCLDSLGGFKFSFLKFKVGDSLKVELSEHR